MKAEDFLDRLWSLKEKDDFKRVIDNVDDRLPFYITTSNSALFHQDGRLQATMSVSEYEKDRMYLGKSIGDGERGKILSHFSKVEFILDVIIFLGEGVYSNPSKYEKVKNFWIDDESITTAKKIKYARYNNFISSNTKKMLWQAKDVRNILSHQYMPDLALTSSLSSQLQKQLVKDGRINISEVVEGLMVNSWISLLNDYQKIQQPIVDYVVSQFGLDSK